MMTRWPDLPTSPIFDEVTLPRRATTILRSDSSAGKTEKLLEKYFKTHHLQIWDQRWEQGRRGREESGSGGTFLSLNYCPRTRHIHHLNPNICIQMELNLHQMRHILDNMKQKIVCVCCVYVWICIFVVCVSQLLEVGRVLGALRHPQVSDSMCATAVCLAFSTGLPPRPWVTFSFSFLYRPATQAPGHISLAVNVCFNSSFTLRLKHNWIAEVNSSWLKL